MTSDEAQDLSARAIGILKASAQVWHADWLVQESGLRAGAKSHVFGEIAAEMKIVAKEHRQNQARFTSMVRACSTAPTGRSYGTFCGR
jgi:hypothetical protein